ncbi:MAG: hypothetical protein ABJF01_14450 [bacterium]
MRTQHVARITATLFAVALITAGCHPGKAPVSDSSATDTTPARRVSDSSATDTTPAALKAKRDSLKRKP